MDTPTVAPGTDVVNDDHHEEPVDAVVVDEPPTAAAPAPGHDLAVRTNGGPALAVTPSVDASELVARLDVIKQAMHNAMVEGIDYGKVPGVSKPTLLKPGAEKLGVLFQLDVQIVNEKSWGSGGHLTVVSKATAYHAPTRTRLGYGEGICSTHEKKYGKRRQARTCPACGVEAIIKGKAEYGGGWVCFKKKDGCGAKYADDDQAITGQEVGEVDNPDIPDTWNTVVKMGEKRARVDAVLAVTGASALFTQDVEDNAAPEPEQPPAPAGPVLADELLAGRAKAALRVHLDEEAARGTYRLIIRMCGHGADVTGLTRDAALAIEGFAAALADNNDPEAAAA